MDLKNKSLVEWLQKNQLKKNFPFDGKVNYYERYTQIKEYLDLYVHPEINTMTLSFENKMYLTKHGTEHIDVVIKRLGELVNTGSQKNIALSPYEIYLLLVATQLHDTGHIKKGRTLHEANSKTVMDKLGLLLGNETVEKKVIWMIAQAHGGRTPEGKKDKIDHLPISEPILNIPVKQRMLAALLRLADELSDDHTRASKFLMETDSLIKESEIYHIYASVLHSIQIDHEGGEIKLFYHLEKKHLTEVYGKGTDSGIEYVYLIDEIYERLFKMYMEFTYCMRFISSANKLNTINAKINFVDSTSYLDFREAISIRMSETGYPKMNAENLFELCPDQLYDKGIKVDGQYFSQYLSKTNVQD